MTIIHLQNLIARQRLELSQAMALIVDSCLDLLCADGAAIELTEDADLVLRATSGLADGFLGLHLDKSKSLSGLCAATGIAQICSDTETDDRVDRAACRAVGIRSILLSPLHHEGQIIGALIVASKKAAAFNDTELITAGLLTDALSAEMHFANQYTGDNLYYHATHDQMTGLANRAMFYDRLRNELTRTEREGSEFGLMILDMDGLKAINDTYGHRAGDAAICEVARRINQTIRKSDTAARLGGDEFGILLQPTHGLAFLTDLARRLGEQIKQPFEFENRPLHLSASIGTSIAGKQSLEIDELIEQADQMMYKNKRVLRGEPATDA